VGIVDVSVCRFISFNIIKKSSEALTSERGRPCVITFIQTRLCLFFLFNRGW
jgi:hypothetical protein